METGCYRENMGELLGWLMGESLFLNVQIVIAKVRFCFISFFRWCNPSQMVDGESSLDLFSDSTTLSFGCLGVIDDLDPLGLLSAFLPHAFSGTICVPNHAGLIIVFRSMPLLLPDFMPNPHSLWPRISGAISLIIQGNGLPDSRVRILYQIACPCQ